MVIEKMDWTSDFSRIAYTNDAKEEGEEEEFD
jgi:hypothetical protein